MAEVQTYVYQGYAYGQFENNKGQKIDFFNLYVTSRFPLYDMPNYHAEGYKAEKVPAVSLEVLRIGELEPGDLIRLYFDAKGKVAVIADADE